MDQQSQDTVREARGSQSFAVVTGAIALLGLLMQLSFVATERVRWTQVQTIREISISLVEAALAAAVFFGLRWKKAFPRHVLAATLLYVFAAAAAIYRDLGLLSAARAGLYPSWICVLLLAYATLVHAEKRTHVILVAASVAAFPLTALVLYLVGYYEARPHAHLLASSFSASLPTLVCGLAGLALVARGREQRARIDAMSESLVQLGSYTLEEKLGEGGMGEVWRARHSFLAKPAAVKIVRAEMIGGGEGPEGLRMAKVALARFEREARATARLTSPHTIQIFDFGQSSPTSFFYAMELLDGIDLHTLVYKYGVQPEGRVITILAQVAESLAEAHDHGIIHRDIKPANVFLCRLGRRLDHVKVLDFGLVLTDADFGTGDKRAPRLTEAGHITGTPNSMAPEQASGKPIDGRADFYALGCVAYFLLTGTDVFNAENVMQYLVMHVNDPPEPPSKRRRGPPIHPGLEALVLRLLAKSPTDRPADALALLAELAPLAAERPWTQAHAHAWNQAHGIASVPPPRAQEVPQDQRNTRVLRPMPRRH